MIDTIQEIAVDIGGGRAEYFVERARKEPEKTFLVLEPQPLRLLRKPPNLFIVRWMFDENSTLPLKPNSLDEASINFLMGEIKSKKDHSSETIEESTAKYRRVVKSLCQFMKKDGLVRITDAKENIFTIANILKEEGFRITLEPTKLVDSDRTAWSQEFYRVFNLGKRTESEPLILPMAVEAKLS